MSDVTNDLDLLQQRQRASEAQAAQAQDDAVREAATPTYEGYTDFDVRVKAYQYALEKYGSTASDEDVLKAAAKIESYLRGDDVSDS